MGSYNSFLDSQCFCMNNKQREEKKSFGAGETMEGNSGAYLEYLKNEEPGCQA
jgi:hypothetical protein